MRSSGVFAQTLAAVVLIAVSVWSSPVAAGDEATVEGKLIANGEEVDLPYVYVIKLDEGFYDDSDPAWKLLFVENPIEERKLDDFIWDSAFVELQITETSEFDDQPKLQVYSQNMRFSADSGGNMSGGTYPELEITSTGPDRFEGRVYHTEQQEFFDDTYQYDFTFSAPFSDPNAPIGEMLPAGGGEPGKAYLAWVKAIHAGDIEGLKKLVPAEMAEQLDSPDAADEIEFMKLMTPTDVTILGGSTDGETAVLEVEGMMDGEKATGEITLQKMGDYWMATSSSW